MESARDVAEDFEFPSAISREVARSDRGSLTVPVSCAISMYTLPSRGSLCRLRLGMRGRADLRFLVSQLLRMMDPSRLSLAVEQ